MARAPGRSRIRQIGIFNRSHYEDVLVVRVHSLVPKPVWSKRYQQINDFERMLSENGVRIVKFLLYIGKDEQAEALPRAPRRPSKNWKFSAADIKEREYWDQYIEAYEDMLRKCSTSGRPGTSFRPTTSGSATWRFPRSCAHDPGEHGPEVPQAHRGPGRY